MNRHESVNSSLPLRTSRAETVGWFPDWQRGLSPPSAAFCSSPDGTLEEGFSPRDSISSHKPHRVWWQTSWPKFLQKSLSRLFFPLTGAQHSGRRTDHSPAHPPVHPRSSPSWRALGEAVTNQADFHLLEEGRGNGKDENLHLTSSWRVPLYISLLHRKNCVIWLACFCEKHIETLYVVGVYSRHRVLSHTPLVSTHVSFGDVLER